MSGFVVVFDGEFDAWDFYQLCVGRTGDRVYCKDTAKLLIEVQAGRPACSEKTCTILPEYKRIAVVIGEERRSVVVFLHVAARTEHGEAPGGGRAPEHVKTRRRGSVRVLALIYERYGNGFRLKTADWVTPETRAMKNPHPSAFGIDVD